MEPALDHTALVQRRDLDIRIADLAHCLASAFTFFAVIIAALALADLHCLRSYRWRARCRSRISAPWSWHRATIWFPYALGAIVGAVTCLSGSLIRKRIEHSPSTI
jgi:hypothetical protein